MKWRVAITALMLVLFACALGAQTEPTDVQPATREQVMALEQKIRALNATVAKNQRLQTKEAEQARKDAQQELVKNQAMLASLVKAQEFEARANRAAQYERNRIERNRFIVLAGASLIISLGALFIMRRIRKGQSKMKPVVVVVNDPQEVWQKITARLEEMQKHAFDPNGLLNSHIHIARLDTDPGMNAVKEYARELGLEAFIVFSEFEGNGVFVPNIAYQVGDERPRAYFTLEDFEERDRGGRYTNWDKRRGRASDLIVCKASPLATPAESGQQTYTIN